MIKATLEITEEQLLDVIQFVKANKITAVFEGALLLEVGKKYKTREGNVVTIECEEYGNFRVGNALYHANGRYYRDFECRLDLIEEVKDELPFEMVVGGVYENRMGDIDVIVAMINDGSYPYGSYQGRTYTQEDTLTTFEKSPYDLIKRIR